jgi:serine/threonine protein kinase
LEKTEHKRILRLAEHGSSLEPALAVPVESFEEPDPEDEPAEDAVSSEPAGAEPEVAAAAGAEVAKAEAFSDLVPAGAAPLSESFIEVCVTLAPDSENAGDVGQLASQAALAEPASFIETSELPKPQSPSAALEQSEAQPPEGTFEHPAEELDSALVGTALDQRYQLQSIIASGSIGTIFKATDLINNQAVAVKIFFDTVGGADAKQQINVMVPEICAFQHPNVLPVLFVGFTSDDRLYVVMPLVEGLTLSHCIDDQQSLSEDDILDIFPQVADALMKMHEEQLVYRGLKPSNIILTPVPNNQLKAVLLDCGTARMLNGICAGALPLTAELFVSPIYMSPEQCTEKTITAQADIYSLGCVMYEAITGHAPIMGDTFAEIVNKHINEKPKPIDDYNLKHHIPQALARIVDKAMEKDPTKRIQSMRSMKMELNRHKMGMTLKKIPPPPPPPPMERRKPRRKSRFNKPIFITLLTLLFLLVAAAIGLTQMWLSARTAPRLPSGPAPVDNIFPGS